MRCFGVFWVLFEGFFFKIFLGFSGDFFQVFWDFLWFFGYFLRGFGVGGRQAGFHFAVMGMLQNGSSPSTRHSSSLLLAVLF